MICYYLPDSINLASEISTILAIEKREINIKIFSDGEIELNCDIDYTKNCLFVHSMYPEPNIKLTELIAFSSIVKKNNLECIFIIPYIAYTRQSYNIKNTSSIYHEIVSYINTVQSNCLITCDSHSKIDIGGRFCDISPNEYMLDYIRENYDINNSVIVSTDFGYAKKAQIIAKELKLNHVASKKIRNNNNIDVFINNEDIDLIKNKSCIIVDDIISTGSTVRKVANELYLKNAGEVHCVVTHLLLHDVKNFIESSKIFSISASNSIKNDLIAQFSIAKAICKYIK